MNITKSHLILASLVMLASLVAVRPVRAQGLNLYTRITDPRASARLSVPDSAPTQSAALFGDGKGRMDWSDTSGIIAQDTGSGVITHIWSVSGMQDPTQASMKLYIDDTLVIAGDYPSFFNNIHGCLRPPFNSAANGAYVWDVQIPYHKGFRLTLKTQDGNMYFDATWRHVAENVLPRFSLSPIASEQSEAERQIQTTISPWGGTGHSVISRSDSLVGSTNTTMADLTGPGMLQALRFELSAYDSATLDSTWLDIYWDRSPLPAVHVPLADFFLSPVAVTYVRAFPIHADRDSGFTSYFPMPFATHARVEIVRANLRPLVVHSTVQYDREQIDRSSYGYFHADFHESNPTRYHVNHPVVHAKGRGRYVGMSFGVLGHPYYVFLEGDPIFAVDSNPKYYTRYTGGEDYFDAAWWFKYGVFTLPFAGYTDVIDQFYRFQFLDCFDFVRSFDFVLQPAGNADVYDHYRTVGYYYKHWTPFWTSTDTIRVGMSWAIGGSGYSPNSAIEIDLGPYHISTNADSDGGLQLTQAVPQAWAAGLYDLSVNGETAPEKIHVLSEPALRAIVDTLPITLRAGDSLLVRGIGFAPGERVRFFLDSISLDQFADADSAYGFTTLLRMPYFPDRSYLLVARGQVSGNATAHDRLAITRTMPLEFEEMMPPVDTSPSHCWAQNISYYWDAMWSKQMLVYFQPDSPFVNAHATFGFAIEHADTFAMNVHGSIGLDLGNYRISLDGKEISQYNFWYNNTGWDPQPSGAVPIGTHYLTEGKHTITFTCLGKSDSSRGYWIEPDVLLLTPTTYMPPLPGTILNSLDSPSPNLLSSRGTQLKVYPNPTSFSTLDISFEVPDAIASTAGSLVRFTLYDELGRKRHPFVNGGITEGGYHGTMSVSDLPAGVYYLTAQFQRGDGYTTELSRTRFCRQ